MPVFPAMIELDAANAADYLASRGVNARSVETISGGVSNQVLRYETDAGLFVLKQSRPQLRTKDAWFSDLDRIFREHDVMVALQPMLPVTVVPKIAFIDRANYAYAMEHAPTGARPWKDDLLAGRIDPSLGASAGSILGTIHQQSATKPETFAPFRERKVYHQLRVEPFYERVQPRRPEVASALAPLIAEMMSSNEALCHGDFTPKNMLVQGTGITLVDYETAHVGDPTMDLGLFHTHLVLKAVLAPKRRRTLFDTLSAFWAGYHEQVRFASASDLTKRGLRHLGACLLARIDGASPADYLLPFPERQETIRDLGRALLLAGPSDFAEWSDVWSWCDDRFREFEGVGGS